MIKDFKTREFKCPPLFKGAYHFPQLEKLGVINCFTDKTTIGNMSLTNFLKAPEEYPEQTAKFEQLFLNMGISPIKDWVHIRAESAADIRYLDRFNYLSLRDSRIDKNNSVDFLGLPCDGLITTENLLITITPADCAIVCITGLDKNTNKRFIIVTHSGLAGTIAEITTRAYKIAQIYYDFDNENLQVAIFPAIRKEHYVKPTSYLEFEKLQSLNSDNWKPFIIMQGATMQIDVIGKLYNEILKLEVPEENIYISDLDPYIGHTNGDFYSFLRAKEEAKGEESHRSAVCLSLRS